MLDLSKDDFLKMDEIKQRANSIFTANAAPTVSSKFIHSWVGYRYVSL